jgi:hypothetical protein
MSETKKRRQVFCRVKHTKAGTDIAPCDALSSVLIYSYGGAGARLATMFPFTDGIPQEGRNKRLVIAPTKKQGKGVVANFCPYCGEPLTEGGRGFVAEQAKRRCKA